MDVKVLLYVVVCTAVFSVTVILVLPDVAFLDVMAGAEAVVVVLAPRESKKRTIYEM